MKLEVGGIEAFNAALNNFGKSFQDQVNKVLLETAMTTKAIAQMRCQPTAEDDAELAADIRAVAGSINFEHDKEKLTATVFAGNTQKDHFAAYVEFGTGPHAERYLRTIPVEYTFLAWQFFVNGKGTMREHPYLIPTYLEQGPKFIERLKGIRPDFR